MKLSTFVVVAASAAVAYAECPNACSGHGLCSEHDQCKCDPNYMGADCSLRVCPFDLAFVDVPRGDLNHDGAVSADSYSKVQWSNVKEFEVFPTSNSVYAAKDGESHFYAECSGKGECDREAGECKCYNGYTGSACQRTACPKDCSGHGVCRTMKEIAAGSLNKREVQSFAGHKYFSGVRDAFTYNLWDADKHQACVCDAGFGGADCSQRLCPRGDDPLTTDDDRHRWCGGKACTWEKQSFTLSSAGLTTFKIGFTDSLNNTMYAYASVDVSGNPAGLGFVDSAKRATALPGPATVAGQIMEALRTVPGGLLQRVEVYPKEDANVNPGSDLSRTFEVTFVGVPGDQAKMTVTPVAGPGTLSFNPDSATYPASTSREVIETSTGNFEQYECSGRGLCDSAQGLCKCFTGFSGAACEYQNALSM